MSKFCRTVNVVQRAYHFDIYRLHQCEKCGKIIMRRVVALQKAIIKDKHLERRETGARGFISAQIIPN